MLMTIDNKRMSSLKEVNNQSLETKKHSLPSPAIDNTLFDKLAENVSDKLRSSLFVIKSYSQLLQRDYNHSRLAHSYELMEAASKRMEKTISEFLVLTSIYTNESNEKELSYFREAFDNAIFSLYNVFEANKKVEIETDFSELTKIWFSKTFLLTIFAELIANAIIHNTTKENLKIKIKSYKLMNSFVLQIEDNGNGFDSFQLNKKVKDPFNSQSSLEQCIGVGLSKIEAIAKVCNCIFDIESKPGEGTTCRFYFR